jgi:hypothetical protein
MTGMIPGAEDEVGALDTGALEALLTQFGGAGPRRRAPAVFPELTTEAYEQAVEHDRAARPYDLLLQLGLGMMASRSPSLFGAIGEAGKTALANVEKTGNQNVRELVQKAQIGGQIAAGEQQRATRQALRTALDADAKLTPAQKQIILADPDGAGRTYLSASMQTPRPSPTVTVNGGVFERDVNAPGGLGRRLGDAPNNAPQVVLPRAETAYEAARGKDIATEVQAASDAASKARDTIASVETLSGLLGQIETGALAPSIATLGGAMQSVGINPERFGIDPKLPATAQAARSIISRLVMDQIGAGGIPANGFSNADREFLEKAQVSLSNRPEANELILEVARRKARRTIEYQRGLARADAEGFDAVRRFRQTWDEYSEKNPAFAGLTLPGGRQAGGGSDTPRVTYTPEQEDQIKRARAAIARGASRDAIAKRLRDLGVEPPGDL